MIAVASGSTSRVGIGAGDSLFFATAVVSAAAVFMAVGLLVGQLTATRHDANVLGAAVLAGSYLVRMAADSDSGLTWLRWLSPLGWIEELDPLTRRQRAPVASRSPRSSRRWSPPPSSWPGAATSARARSRAAMRPGRGRSCSAARPA